jgi:SSS family solute:Na+ symporter
MSIGLLVVTGIILYDPGWSALVMTVERHYGAGGFNPFKNAQLGWTFVIFQALISLAVVLTWQTNIQRLLAAKDSKTGRKIYTHTSFFFVCRFLIPGLWGIAALATFSSTADATNSLHAMPRFLSITVPMGLSGLLIAAMLAADMSTDSAYMLSWGSVIYNDILAPLRRRQQWSAKYGLLVSRMIVGAIGVFLLAYGLWYPLKDSLWNYLTITGTIYLSSMSVLLIACCYWKQANNWGAAAAIAVGATVPISYLIAEQLPATQKLAADIGTPASGVAAFVLTAIAMVAGSLIKPLFVPSAMETIQ